MTTLGIDLGGTNARAAVVEADGRLVASVKTRLVSREPRDVVAAVAEAARAALARSDTPFADCVGCGVGVAGQLEGDTGVVSVAPNLGWRGVDFGGMLRQALGFEVRVVNDLSAAAWGEFKAGAGRGVEDLFVVFVGSGVGSALVCGGRLVQGASGVAGEFGHVKVVPEQGRTCGCGEQGCLEAYLGGHNLIAQMKELMDQGLAPTLQARAQAHPLGANPQLLEEVALEGSEPAVTALYQRVRHHLALALANQVTVLNPKHVVLGGGVLAHCPGLRQGIVEGIEKYASWVSRKVVQVVDAKLGDDSGIIGAALLARGG